MRIPNSVFTVLFTAIIALQCWALRELVELKQKVAVIESRTALIRPDAVTFHQKTNHLAHYESILP